MAKAPKRAKASARKREGLKPGRAARSKTNAVELKLDTTDYGCQMPSLLPLFKIFVNGREAGYISTGHSMLFEKFRGLGNIFFSQALPQYEAFHLKAFKQGLFEEYKRQVINWIGIHQNKAAFAAFITSLKEPTHIEFWRYPDIARKYMEHGGYELCKPSIRELKKRGLPKKATREQTIEFLKTFQNAGSPKVLFVLTKPAKTEQTQTKGKTR